MNRSNYELRVTNKRSGFSLVEVLVFVSILSVFFVVSISVTIASVRNMKINEHKILASHYSRELEDWLRNEKEKDFTVFASSRANSSGITYCFNTSPISSWSSSGSCASNGLSPAIFKREVVLKNNAVGVIPPSRVEVQITVRWDDVGTTYSVPVTTVFSIYE